MEVKSGGRLLNREVHRASKKKLVKKKLILARRGEPWE